MLKVLHFESELFVPCVFAFLRRDGLFSDLDILMTSSVSMSQALKTGDFEAGQPTDGATNSMNGIPYLFSGNWTGIG